MVMYCKFIFLINLILWYFRFRVVHAMDFEQVLGSGAHKWIDCTIFRFCVTLVASA